MITENTRFENPSFVYPVAMRATIRLVTLLLIPSVWNGWGTARAQTRPSEQLEIRVLDEQTGKPIPVRMHLKDARGRAVRPNGVIAWHDHFIIPGIVVLELRPGSYTFEMERGPEYKIRTGSFTIRRGDADSTQLRMERFVDMKQEGWWSGDLLVQRPVADIPLLMAAEDLNVAPIITWDNDRNAWEDQTIPEVLVQRVDDHRLFQLMAGRDRRVGGALLYFNLRQPLPIRGAQPEIPSSCDFLVMARRFPDVHVDMETPFSWDLPLWIASGMVDSIGLCNQHMQRDGMLSSESGGKPRDRLMFPEPHGNGRWSEFIYYRLLESGIRLPPSASSGSGLGPNPPGYSRVYVHCGPHLDYLSWWTNLRAGRVVVTNGPLIRDPLVNGELPGHVFQADEGETIELLATLSLSLREQVDYLEIVKNGRIEHEVRLDEVAKAGGRLPKVTFQESGWMLIRAVTSHPRTYRFASTGPYYVEIGDRPRVSRQAAQFFADWVQERARQIDIADPQQRESVIRYHRAARDFWANRVLNATAD
jgi:hypothetical protein